MTIWLLGLTVLNLFLGLGLAILWLRIARPPKDDPRLSRGLQLLQSKIAVLEDLSDRTDNQVKQLIDILEERGKILQQKIFRSEEMMAKIEQSMAKSLDVAKIFQDKIPHEEIIERNQTSKYVLAAKLAHEGRSIDEIATQVDLPKSEIEFIAKVNRDELSFNPDLLPEWAKASDVIESAPKAIEDIFLTKLPDLTALNSAKENFDQAVRSHAAQEQAEADRIKRLEDNLQAVKATALHTVETAVAASKHVGESAATLTGQIVRSATEGVKNAKESPVIKKVQFPRIWME